MTSIIRTVLTLIFLNDAVTCTQSHILDQRLNNLPLVLATLKNIDYDPHYGDSSNGHVTSVASADDTCNITTIISKSSGQIKSVNHPDPYPTNCQWTYVIHVGNDRMIQVKVLDWDVDTDQGDELSIQPISSKDKNTYASKQEYTFSSSNNSTTTAANQSFELDNPCCDSAIIKFIAGNHSNNHTGFLLLYRRQGKTVDETCSGQDSVKFVHKTFITDESNTEASSPFRVPGWHQVYLCGMQINEFNEHEKDFRNSLINSAEKYSKEKNLILETGKISLHQILINMVVQCPSSWPSSSNCLQVNYSVKLEDNGAENEMTSDHLEEMWDMYCDTDELTNLGLWEYEIPNVQWLFWFWIGLLCFLSLFFCLLLIIIVKTKLIYYYFLRLKFTNSQQMTADFLTWQQQNMMMPLFTAENTQRFQFVRSYEKLNNLKPLSSCQNISTVNAEESSSKTASDNLEQEDDQHIYQTLTPLFLKNSDKNHVSEDYKNSEDSRSLTAETHPNKPTENDNPSALIT